MQPILEKVTCFITRATPDGTQLLLLRHPDAGIQFPAGTVEAGEAPEAAALRETFEETGLRGLLPPFLIGAREEPLPAGRAVIFYPATVYARPDTTSFDWARLPRGAPVSITRRAGAFVQVAYKEGDSTANPRRIAYHIQGWVEGSRLAYAMRRSFFHLRADDEQRSAWQHNADHHRFELFWAPLSALPTIVSPQDGWLPYAREKLGYHFG